MPLVELPAANPTEGLIPREVTEDGLQLQIDPIEMSIVLTSFPILFHVSFFLVFKSIPFHPTFIERQYVPGTVLGAEDIMVRKSAIEKCTVWWERKNINK